MSMVLTDMNADCLLRVMVRLDTQGLRNSPYYSDSDRHKLRLAATCRSIHEVMFSDHCRRLWTRLDYGGNKMHVFGEILRNRVALHVQDMTLDLCKYLELTTGNKLWWRISSTDAIRCEQELQEMFPILPNLRTLNTTINNTEILGPKVPELRSIVIGYPGKIGNRALKGLANSFPNLEYINLSSYRRHSRRLLRSFLMSKTALKAVALPGTEAGDVSVGQVADWLSMPGSAENLIRLRTGTVGDNDVINGIGRCCNLQTLVMYCSRITDTGLMPVRNLANLRTLVLLSTDIACSHHGMPDDEYSTPRSLTAAGIAEMLETAAFKLRMIKIDGNCGDAAVTILIERNAGLQRVELRGPITKTGLRYISSLRDLKRITCDSQTIDETVLDCFNSDKLTNLVNFKAEQMSVSPDARMKFKEHFASCKAYFWEGQEGDEEFVCGTGCWVSSSSSNCSSS